MSGSDEAAIRSSLQTTRHRDPARVAAALDRWLAAHGGGRVAALHAPDTSGASSELFLADLEDAPVAGPGRQATVLRLVGAHAVYPHVDAEMQFLCQCLLAERSAAPVPPALGFEPACPDLGAAFILMRRAEGRGAPDLPSYVRQGWIHDLGPAERGRLWQGAVDAVAAVHATPLDGVDAARLFLPTPGARPIDRLVAYWELYLSVVRRAGDYPALEHAVAWLRREKPDLDEPPRMVWGDASLRNMLFDGLRPAALLDLEFAHLGVAQFDIAFFAMMDRVMAEAYAGVPRLTGFWDEDATFDRYEAVSGIRVAHRPYFCRMAVTYMALANTRVFQRLSAEGRMPHDDVGRNPPLRFLAQLFGLPS